MISDEIKERCKDCMYLIDDDVTKGWYCDNFDTYCEEVIYCNEGINNDNK